MPGRAVPAGPDLGPPPRTGSRGAVCGWLWNRDLTQVAWLKGETPKSQDLLARSRTASREALKPRAGGQGQGAATGSSLRSRWTVQTAEQWGIDPASDERHHQSAGVVRSARRRRCRGSTPISLTTWLTSTRPRAATMRARPSPTRRWRRSSSRRAAQTGRGSRRRPQEPGPADQAALLGSPTSSTLSAR